MTGPRYVYTYIRKPRGYTRIRPQDFIDRLNIRVESIYYRFHRLFVFFFTDDIVFDHVGIAISGAPLRYSIVHIP